MSSKTGNELIEKLKVKEEVIEKYKKLDEAVAGIDSLTLTITEDEKEHLWHRANKMKAEIDSDSGQAREIDKSGKDMHVS